MQVLNVRNCQEALPFALRLLEQEGEERQSRNGPVLIGPSVTTVYSHPCEKVVFFPQRDSNIFFLAYESLWMLSGRNDLNPLRRYVSTFGNFSDDGKTLNGAYGYRWKKSFGKDQLQIIARRLKENPDDRRCVLQMWDATQDLDSSSLDIPCNLVCTFQRGIEGELNLTVFCRSNDILWGAYFANAFQFGMLIEYMALAIGCPIGTYTQISVNWHGYLNTLETVKTIRPDRVNFVENPYTDRRVHVVPMVGSIEELDEEISLLLEDADTHFSNGSYYPDNPWSQMIYLVLQAHEVYKDNVGEKKYINSLKILEQGDPKADWIVASKEWIERRYAIWHIKQATKGLDQILNGSLEHP